MSYNYIDPLDAAPEDMKPDGVITLVVGITCHCDFNNYVMPRHMV